MPGTEGRIVKIYLLEDPREKDEIAQVRYVGKAVNPRARFLKHLSVARKGATENSETRAKVSAAKMGNKACLGRHHSEDTKAKISAAQRGEKNHQFGIPHTPETIIRMITAHRIRRAKENAQEDQIALQLGQ